MRKMISILFATFLFVSMMYSFDIEEVAGFESYEINFGLKNYSADPYGAFKLSLSLPVMEQIKLGFITGVDLAMTNYTLVENKNEGEQGRYETQNWSKINTNFDLFIGLPIPDIMNLTIMAAGGTVFTKYDFVKDTIHNYSKETVSGYGYGKLGLGMMIKSSLFNDVISDVKVRQFLTVLGGSGVYDKSFTDATSSSDMTDDVVVKIDGVENLTKRQYVGVLYSGLVNVTKPFEIGLPKFALGFEVDYNVDSVTYTKVENSFNGVVQSPSFSKNPVGVKTGAGLKINLALNPTATQENNFWVKPSFSINEVSYTLTSMAKKSLGTLTNTVAVGSNWKATFAKIVWLKFDVEYRFAFSQNFTTSDNVGDWKWESKSGNLALTHFMDPGITLGFNFEGWNAEFKWAPKAVVSTSIANPAGTNYTTTATNLDTNIWSLANWKIEVSTKFPALYKKTEAVNTAK